MDVRTDREVSALLLEAERSVGLLDRVTPENLKSERQRLLAALTRNDASEPVLTYAPGPHLRETRTALDALVTRLEGLRGPIAQLYAGRAEELVREAELVEAVGRPSFRALAEKRFSAEALAPGRAVEDVLVAWGSGEPKSPPQDLAVSDDDRDEHSLVNVLRVHIGRLRLPIRIEVRAQLPTTAAATEDAVLIRPAMRLSHAAAERIARHELEGHVLPRLAARRERLGLFRTGSRGSSDEEEGRALLIEERAGYLDAIRRRELVLRHRAASAVRSGATFTETVSLLRGSGADLEPAVDMALRALRGGGLGRELMYVPAFMRVSEAFRVRPELERLFERGRVSVEAAEVLAQPSVPAPS